MRYSLRKRLLLLLLLAAFGYLIVKALLWWRADAYVESLASTAAPFVRLKYGAIRSDLIHGRVGIYDIEVVPGTAEYGVPAAALYLETGNPLDLALLSFAGTDGSYQGPVKIAVQGLEIDTRSQWLHDLDQARKAAGKDGFDLASCDPKGLGGLSDLQRLGQDQVKIDGYLAVVPDPGAGVRIRFGLDLVGLASMRSEFDIGGVRDLAEVGDQRGVIQRIEFQYSEPELGHTRRALDLCASLAGQESARTYADQWAHELRDRWAKQGVGISDELADALRNYFRDPRSIDLTLRSTEGVSAQDLLLAQGDVVDLQSLFDVFLTVNEKSVRNATLKRLSRPDTADGDVAANSASSIKELETLRREYRDVPLTALEDYIGQMVRISTNDKKVHQGKLARLDERSLELSRLLLGGKMTFPIPREKLIRVEVLMYQPQ